MASAIGGLTSRVVRTFDRLGRSASRALDIEAVTSTAPDGTATHSQFANVTRAGYDEGASGQQELYLVLEGEAMFELDGEEAHLGRGTALAITEPSVRRSARAVRPGTTLLIVGAGRSPFTSTWNPSHFTDIRRPD